MDQAVERVSIRPGTKILATLRHLNYLPWFALAEFVDNAVQSFLAGREILAAAGQDRLTVRIELQGTAPTRISVRDDALGIAAADFPRAFKPAEVPPDATGLSEFGMGMKSAACWFAPRWHVKTTAIGEPFQRTVRFDIEAIAASDLEELEVDVTSAPMQQHFTEIILESPFIPIVGRRLGKIREHLSDIYRCQIRDGLLALHVGGELLSFDEPKVLVASYYRDPTSAPLLWRKEVDMDVGGGQRARGFAALREKGKGTRAGFALFRRGRLIQGSGDEGWKHQEVFGSPNSYRHQRLFGELHLDNFEVSHTKDGFRWSDEAAFADLLANELDSGDLPLLKQGEGHRERAARPVMQRSAATAVAGANEDMRTHLEGAMPQAAVQAEAGEHLLIDDSHAVPATPIANSSLEFEFRGARWQVNVQVTDDEAQGEWLVVGDAELVPSGDGRRIDVRVSGAHPFMVRFAHKEPEVMEALIRVAASLSLSEALLRSIGADDPSAIRRTANELLQDVFSSI